MESDSNAGRIAGQSHDLGTGPMTEKSARSGASTKARTPAPARIIEAAKQEFARHGLGGGRVDEIARIAGVSQQLVFHYFQNKENLYAEALTSLADESSGFVRDVDFDAMSPPDAIEFIVRGIFLENETYGARFIADQIIQDGAQISSRNRIASYHARLEQIIESALMRGRSSGHFTATIQSRELLMAAISLSLGQSAMLDLLGAAGHDSRPSPHTRAWADFAVSFIMRALTNTA